MENKLLIQQNISFGNPGQITFRGGNNIDNLVNKVLYWDSIVNLNTGLVGSPINQDIETLRREGIFEDVKVDVIGEGEFSMMVATATNSKILTLLDDKSINYIPDNLSPRVLVNEGFAHNTGGALIHMVNSMPFIDVNTPLDEVLEFRQSRKEQLKHLTTTLNSMELRVLEAQNQAMELKKVMNEIDMACLEIYRLYNEKKLYFDSFCHKIKLQYEEYTRNRCFRVCRCKLFTSADRSGCSCIGWWSGVSNKLGRFSKNKGFS
ncbi:TPA: hypothetical protein MFY10_25605 [Klebsiella pneumoniae]|nr:hypothetical protein [Klebsiella pneumoniae]